MSWTDDIELPDPYVFVGVGIIKYRYKTELTAHAMTWIYVIASFKLASDAADAARELRIRLGVTRRLLGLMP